MALIKYSGKENIVVTINGERKLIKPNRIFSGPQNLGKNEGFELLGVTKKEVGKENRSKFSIKLNIKDDYEPFVDFPFLKESGFPKISICIVTKDNPSVIRKCLESIHKYVAYGEYEILICDTGTTDEEVFDVYSEYQAKFWGKLKIYKDHTYNFSANNNFLARKATGDVLLFMNNDVFLTYDAVSEMVKYTLCSNIGCVGHRLVWEAKQDEIQHDGQLLYDPRNGKWIGPGHHNYHRKLVDVSNEDVLVEGVTAAFLMVRKSIFEKVNGFDELYKDIYQDVDLNLKIRKAGYENFCVRSKSVIHVDHASRVDDATADSPADARKFRDDWISKGNFPVVVKRQYSILVCATNTKQLKALKDSIKSKEEYEFIFINNTSNYFWSSESLNILTKVSSGDLMFHMHQDVTFDAYEPFLAISEIISKLGNTFGIIGPAGIQVGGKGAIRGVDFSALSYNFDFLRVQTLDEFCLISQRKNKFIFGEYLDHFHFYGADICCQALEKKLNNYVIRLPITHHSGGDINLRKRGGYESYLKQGKKFFKHWKERYPYISTTTCHYRGGKAHWYLGEMLGLEPFIENINFDRIDETENKKKYLTHDTSKYLDMRPSGVSIVILSKDRPEYIKRCIGEIRKYTKGIDYEILIGDTGSTDKEVLDFYKKHNGDHFKVIDAGDYQFSMNNNKLAQDNVKYNKVLFLNNDVFLKSNSIEYMSNKIKGDLAIVGLKLLYENGTIQHSGVEMVVSKERNPNEWYLPEHIDYEKKNYKSKDKLVDCVTGACLMMPTELFLEYGGFDEDFDKVFQDVDLCLKMHRGGYDSICCNEREAIHIESGTRDPEINTNDYNLLTERWGKIKY